MAELFASGRIIDVILALVALEALALLAWRVRRGRGPSVAMLLSNLASGAALMVAVRAALTDAHWTIIASCLLAALGAHLTEMCFRFRVDAGSLGRGQVEEGAGTSTTEPAFSARR